ncbi:MAG: PDGLE domain-containing protein [Solirubrobacteraceae bacterium]|nr:PDGLE domain-containing protein [Solirubrobacteraceae bacterium]
MKLVAAFALVLAIGLAVAVSPFASSSPDGLNKVAEDHGFADTGKLHAVQEDAPIPGYAFPGVSSDGAATALAGLAGVLGVFVLGTGMARVLRRRPHATP